MDPEKPKIPDWAKQERERDLSWIRDNMHVFIPAATAGFKAAGRGVIVVDTTSVMTAEITSQLAGEGHPYGYFPQEMIERVGDEDITRMVRAYDPETDLVLVLLKGDEKMSSYRVQLPQGAE